MEIEHLENFIVLALYQNFGEAADALFISQSTLSKRIMKLEEQVGVLLFDRTTKSVVLNQYGKLFLDYAERIVELERESLREIDKLLPKSNRVLRIGAIPSFAEYRITELVSNYMRSYGKSVQVITAPSEKLEVMLLNNECDFAFIRQVHDNQNLFLKIPIVSDKMVAIVPKDHSLANRDYIEIKDLKHEKFVMQPENSRPYDHCISLCKKNGFEPEIIFTDAQIKNIVGFVGNGLGVSMLMEKVVIESLNESVRAIEITPIIRNEVVLCSLKTRMLEASQKDYITFIKSEIKK